MGMVRDTDKGMASISKLLQKLKRTTLKVGVFSDAKNTENKTTRFVADYAIANEFGTKNIPERSFLRSTSDKQRNKWSKTMDNAATKVIATQGTNFDRELYKVGAIVRSDIIKKINSNISPINAESTKKHKKGKNKTLIEHGVLRSSIEARIES